MILLVLFYFFVFFIDSAYSSSESNELSNIEDSLNNSNIDKQKESDNISDPEILISSCIEKEEINEEDEEKQSFVNSFITNKKSETNDMISIGGLSNISYAINYKTNAKISNSISDKNSRIISDFEEESSADLMSPKSSIFTES